MMASESAEYMAPVLQALRQRMETLYGAFVEPKYIMTDDGGAFDNAWRSTFGANDNTSHILWHSVYGTFMRHGDGSR